MLYQYDNRPFMFLASLTATMLCVALPTHASGSDQQRQVKEESGARRTLNTNESAIVSTSAATLTELRGKGTPEAAEQRLAVVARLDRLWHVAVLPVLQSVAQDDSESPQTRVCAVRAIARTQDTNAVDVLIDLISVPHPQVYSAAVEGLENATGVHLGNVAYASAEAFATKRTEMQQKWQGWWKTNSAAFRPREDAVFWHRD